MNLERKMLLIFKSKLFFNEVYIMVLYNCSKSDAGKYLQNIN